jgi:hypothetical protein
LRTSHLTERRQGTRFASLTPPVVSRRHGSSTLDPLLGLQRQAGNRAVVGLLGGQSGGTVQRANGLQERMAALAKQGLSDPKASAALERQRQAQEEELTAKAFQSSTFYYGTTGGTGVLKKFLDALTEKKRKELPYYWPGERAKQYLGQSTTGGAEPEPVPKATPSLVARPAPNAGINSDAQMMDMYYGMEGTSLHQLRNPQIGKYVHQKMGYQGAYDQATSGREAYIGTYSKGINEKTEGWQYPQAADDSGKVTRGQQNAIFHHPVTGEALTGTMEISRHIRDGIFKYGGTLVFEGRFIYNEGNFVPGAYQGDTNKEAVALFPYLADNPGKSRVAFGKGTLVFQYGGQETVPTQWLFRQKWAFKRTALPKEEVADVVPKGSIFWQFPEGDKEISKTQSRWVKTAYDAVSAAAKNKS